MGKVILIGTLVVLIAGIATCGFYQCEKAQSEPPSENTAEYMITVSTSGMTTNIFYSDDVEQNEGETILHGYWENVNGKYQYNERGLRLNKNWGTIKVERR